MHAQMAAMPQLSSELKNFLAASKLQLVEVDKSSKVKLVEKNETSFLSNPVKQDWLLIDNPGGGDCLLYSLAHQTDKKNITLLREEIKVLVQANRKNIEPFLDNETWDNYIERMSEMGEQIGDLEVSFLPQLFKRPVWVIRKNGRNLTLNAQGRQVPTAHYRYGEELYPNAKPIYLYHEKYWDTSGHYMAAIPKFNPMVQEPEETVN